MCVWNIAWRLGDFGYYCTITVYEPGLSRWRGRFVECNREIAYMEECEFVVILRPRSSFYVSSLPYIELDLRILLHR
jgi:hypothetical protein